MYLWLVNRNNIILLQKLTSLLPKQLSDSVELACCKITDRYPDHVLTCTEKAAWNSFESTTRRNEYLSSRWLIHQMAQQMDMSSGDFQLKKNEQGRPFGEYSGNRYFVSIAHSKGETVGAISPSVKIGVDLEPQNRSVSDELRSRLLNKSEQALLDGEPTIRLWTLKEAILKLNGSGLRTNLKDWLIVTKNKSLFTAESNKKERAQMYSFSHQNNWIAIAYNS